MSKLRSLFPGSSNIQLMIDASATRYAPLWYPQYFDVAPPQTSLTYTSVIGRNRIEAAATVVSRGSKTPLRSRQGLEKLNGEIPPISEMFSLDENQYRDYLSIQSATGVSDEVKRNQMLDLVWGDVKRAGDAPHKRVDALALMAVSTGTIKINVTNNPDGAVQPDIDLLMPASNKKNAAVSWAIKETATPITDIETVVEDARGRGLSFAKILMTKTLWLKFKKAKEVVDSLIAYYYASKPAAGFNPIAVSTIEKVNEFLSANMLPIIEIVDTQIGVEKDGKVSPFEFFEANNVAFVPAGKLGVIKNALAMEQLRPTAGIDYANYNGVLISKWSENEPWGEHTKGEWNAFPALEAIDSMYILTAVL